MFGRAVQQGGKWAEVCPFVVKLILYLASFWFLMTAANPWKVLFLKVMGSPWIMCMLEVSSGSDSVRSFWMTGVVSSMTSTISFSWSFAKSPALRAGCTEQLLFSALVHSLNEISLLLLIHSLIFSTHWKMTWSPAFSLKTIHVLTDGFNSWKTGILRNFKNSYSYKFFKVFTKSSLSDWRRDDVNNWKIGGLWLG